MRASLVFALVMSCAMPGVVHACIEPAAERHVFLAQPPRHLPHDLLLLKVRVIALHDKADVEIIESADGLRGVKAIRVDPGSLSSCGRWGETHAPAYVVGTLERGIDATIVFRALQLPLRRYRSSRSPAERDSYILR